MVSYALITDLCVPHVVRSSRQPLLAHVGGSQATDFLLPFHGAKAADAVIGISRNSRPASELDGLPSLRTPTPVVSGDMFRSVTSSSRVPYDRLVTAPQSLGLGCPEGGVKASENQDVPCRKQSKPLLPDAARAEGIHSAWCSRADEGIENTPLVAPEMPWSVSLLCRIAWPASTVSIQVCHFTSDPPQNGEAELARAGHSLPSKPCFILRAEAKLSAFFLHHCSGLQRR